MRRRYLWLIIMVLVVAACGGDDEDTEDARVITATTRNFPTVAPPSEDTITLTPAEINPGTGDIVFSGQTNPYSDCPIPLGWQGYVVAPGDTLSVIATSVGSTVDTLQEGNCLSDTDTILVGQLLYLPTLPPGAPTLELTPGLSDGVTTFPTTDPGGAETTNCTLPQGWTTYTVRAGDTLGALAQNTGTTVAQLQSANCLGTAEIIYVGQTLYLPRQPQGVLTTATAIPTIQTTLAATPAACPPPAGWVPYTISPGDTLVIIAARFGTTVSQLQSANCLTDINRIFVGQTLYVPGSGDDVAPAATLTPTVQQAQPISTPTAASTQIDTEGQPPDLSGNSLTVRPTLAGDGGTLITLQPTVALDIGTVPDAAEVRYLAQTSPTDPNPVVVATDDDPFDGTRVEYTFNEFDAELYFYAIAENEFGSSTSFIQHVVYDPTYAVGSGKPDIFPFLGFDGSIYTLEPGRTVTVAWTNAPTDAQRIEFLLIQGTGTTLINTDTNPSDGARILWPVPAQLRGQVFARAVYTDGSTVDTEPVFVYSETE